MKTVFISPEEMQSMKHWDNTSQLSLSILKDKGAPILGTVILRLDPQYTFKAWRDADTLGIFVGWS